MFDLTRINLGATLLALSIVLGALSLTFGFSAASGASVIGEDAPSSSEEQFLIELEHALPAEVLSVLTGSDQKLSNHFGIFLGTREDVNNPIEAMLQQARVSCNRNPELKLITYASSPNLGGRVEINHIYSDQFEIIDNAKCFHFIERTEEIPLQVRRNLLIEGARTKKNFYQGLTGEKYSLDREYQSLIHQTPSGVDSISVSEIRVERRFWARLYYSLFGFLTYPGEPVLTRSVVTVNVPLHYIRFDND